MGIWFRNKKEEKQKEENINERGFGMGLRKMSQIGFELGGLLLLQDLTLKFTG